MMGPTDGVTADRRHTTVRRYVLAVVVALVLSACGSNSVSAPTRAYELRLRAEDSEPDYLYVAEDAVDLRVGDEVTFRMRNTGTLPHDLNVVDPSGASIATAAAVAPGGTLSLTVLFDEPGFYQLNCFVGDHLTLHSMQAIVEVVDADS